jgi:hypothetical protein
MAFTMVRVTRDYTLASGEEPTGYVTFTPEVVMWNDWTIPRVPIPAPLDADGKISQVLAATDDVATTPAGIKTYRVTEKITGAPERQYLVVVPHAAAVVDGIPTVDLATLNVLAVPPVVTFPAPGPQGPMGPSVGVDLRSFLPSPNPGAIDYAPYVQAACDALPDGGALYIPSAIGPTIGFGSSVTPNPGTRIFSDHPAALTIVKLADVPLFDVSGSAASSDGSTSLRNVSFEGMTLAGAEYDTGTVGGTGAGGYADTPKTTWNAPLVKAYYSQFIHFHDVRFRNNYGSGIHGVQWWDSYITRCRFDFLGKGDGTRPAVWAARLVQGTTTGQFGYSADNTNNIWVTDCVGEQNRDGTLWIDGRDAAGANTPGSPTNNRCYVTNLKCETVFDFFAPHVRVDQARFVDFRNLDCVAKGATTPQDLAKFSAVSGLTVDNYNFELKEITSGGVGVAAAIKFVGITGLDFSGGRAIAQTTNKPTVFLSVDATCSGVTIDPWRYLSNPGAASLTSIGASTFAYRSIGRGLASNNIPSVTGTLGTLARKLEVVDHTGAIIGYLPVYTTIT